MRYNVFAPEFDVKKTSCNPSLLISPTAVGDINNDGLQDVFFTSNSGANTLYLNKGSLKFQNISSTSGIIKTGWSTGVVMTDINNDGYLDIYVCQAWHT